MPARPLQALILLILAVAAAASPDVPPAGPSPAPTPSVAPVPASTVPTTQGSVDYAAQLNAECERLVASAIRRPYGWAWAAGSGQPNDPAAKPEPAPAGKPRPVAGRAAPTEVDLGPGGTPAAVLMLLLVGRDQNKPEFVDAALQGARGLAAAQEQTGRIPTLAIFGAQRCSGQDPPQVAPDRKGTQAALGALLMLLDTQEKADPAIRRCAIRAAHWLTTQQTHAGGWPAVYTPPPLDGVHLMNVATDRSRRVIWLSTADYRDSTLGLAYSALVLPEVNTRRPAIKAIDQLLRMRIMESKSARGLWLSIYELGGQPILKLRDVPYAVDIPACRYALQTLIIGDIMLAHDDCRPAMEQAIATISRLPQEPGGWRRIYPLTPPRSAEEPTSQPATQPSEPPATQPVIEAGDFGAYPVLDAVDTLRQEGRAKYAAELGWWDVRKQSALALAGIFDEPLTLKVPENAAGAEAFIRSKAGWWEGLSGPVPASLQAQTRRLWLLMLRAKLARAV